MNKTQRVFISQYNKDEDKHIKVKLEQSVKRIEFLSMSIDSNDVYQNFNSDYGVLVGRVIANNSIGIPNAKISIFIPLTDTDSNNPDIYSIYPYTTPRDINNEGKRYNLLPRVGKYNSDGSVRPPQPFGSFPIKEEIVTNVEFLDVYKKYYKYTATTNDAGDYMIFGVPIGTQTVHMSVDITDIGKYSMSPASMIKSLGYSENLFINNTIIKPSNDLNDLPHIETQEVGVDIIPFWGDTSNFEIGITRQDFKIRSVIRNTFTLFASVFTDGNGYMWGENHYDRYFVGELYRAIDPAQNTVSIASKRISTITEKIYYYPTSVDDSVIDDTNPDADPALEMLLLDKSEYSIYKRNGDIVVIVNCNRDKIITNEFGQDIHVSNDYSGGVFTKFRGFLTLEITTNDEPMNFSSAFGTDTLIEPFRITLKFPQHTNQNQSFIMPDADNVDYNQTKLWRKENYTFTAGNFYSLSRFHGTTANSSKDVTISDVALQPNGFITGDRINTPYNVDPFWNVGIIATGMIGVSGTTGEVNNAAYQFPSNSTTNQVPSNPNLTVFGANWMNFSIYLPQLGYVTEGFSYGNIFWIRTSDNFSLQQPTNTQNNVKISNAYYNEDNNQIIAGKYTNTKWFARADLNWTDIIEVPKNDIQLFRKISTKGFTYGDLTRSGKTLTILDGVNYRNGVHIPANWISPCPLDGGKLNGDPTSSQQDPDIYFYKGFGAADCIEYLFELGLLI